MTISLDRISYKIRTLISSEALGAFMHRATLRIFLFPLLVFIGGTQMGGCGGGQNGTSAIVAGCVEDGNIESISGQFGVLSYNVAGLLEGLSSSQPALFTPMISPLLNAYDLVLVQEDFFYHEELSSQATHPYQSLPQPATWTLSNDGLNRFSIFPMTSFVRKTWDYCNGWFSNSNDCLASKGFSFARHEISEGVFLDVYNLHADAGDGPGDVATRREQVEQLLYFMGLYSFGNAVLVAGDTNLVGYHPEDEPVLQKLIQGGGLTDSARYLGAPESIDRILYRSSSSLYLEASLWEVATEFVDASGTPLSDHEAIHVEMNWTFLP